MCDLELHECEECGRYLGNLKDVYCIPDGERSHYCSPQHASRYSFPEYAVKAKVI